MVWTGWKNYWRQPAKDPRRSCWDREVEREGRFGSELKSGVLSGPVGPLTTNVLDQRSWVARDLPEVPGSPLTAFPIS